MLFSERNKITPAKKVQIKSMDEELKNRLWTEIYLILSRDSSTLILTDFFKLPIDQLGAFLRDEIRSRYFAMRWNQVFDIIEFICKHDNGQWYIDWQDLKNFINRCNRILEEEVSGYRIIENSVVQITSKTELDAIEQALQTPMMNVGHHLQRALELLSERKNPDYSNSIKESISAVEAICRKIEKNDNLTLGQALKIMKKNNKLNIHPSMINAFSNMFGYTSGSSGIRHAADDRRRDIPFAEAKFFLVVCSAFVNYLITINADS